MHFSYYKIVNINVGPLISGFYSNFHLSNSLRFIMVLELRVIESHLYINVNFSGKLFSPIVTLNESSVLTFLARNVLGIVWKSYNWFFNNIFLHKSRKYTWTGNMANSVWSTITIYVLQWSTTPYFVLLGHVFYDSQYTYVSTLTSSVFQPADHYCIRFYFKLYGVTPTGSIKLYLQVIYTCVLYRTLASAF